MNELVFAAPDGGVWLQDGIHFPRPMSRFMQEVFPEGFMRGFKMGTACYGLMLDHIQPAFIHDFYYSKLVMVGAPPDANGPPPREVFMQMCAEHPEIRGRLETAATVLQQRPWREHIRNWDSVLKPASVANHLRLLSRDPVTMSDAALADYLNECFENSKAMVFQHHIYTISCAIPVGDFIGSTQAWTGLSPSDISQALRGSTPISAGVTDEYLAALRALENDADAASIMNGPGQPGAILQQVQALSTATGAAIRAYLALAADRVTGGYDITCPTAIETPEILVRALQAKYSPVEVAETAQRVAEQTARIRAAVPAEHRAAFDDLLAEVRLVNRLRDERSYWSDLWANGISRRAMLEAGRRLARKGAITAAEHVLDASCGEAIALLTGAAHLARSTATPVAAPSAAELAARHRFRTSVPNDTAPMFLNGPPAPPPPLDWFPENTRRTMQAMGVFMGLTFGASDRESEGKTVRGISVSSGQYEGRARVIDNIDSLHLIQKGEVLVTRSTSTAFNYVLPLVGAIVTDRGGLMSHAAIVAREYGLPGVVGCQVATRTIADGARVRVDADNGEVTILS